jgi:hypothetical protein
MNATQTVGGCRVSCSHHTMQLCAAACACHHQVCVTSCRLAEYTGRTSPAVGWAENNCRLDSSLDNHQYRQGGVISGQAPSCHSEPKGWGPMRLCLFIICICTSVHSDSHYSSCRSLDRTMAELPVLIGTQLQHSSSRSLKLLLRL